MSAIPMLGVSLMRIEGSFPRESEIALNDVSSLAVGPEDVSWKIVRGITLIEGHVDRVIDHLRTMEEAKLGKYGMYLSSLHSASDLEVWSARFKILTNGFGLDLKPQVAVQEFQLLVEVRNSLVHGNMELTRRQIQNLDKGLSLRRDMERVLDVAIQGRKLDLRNLQLSTLLSIFRGFVIALGCALPSDNRPIFP